MDLGRPQLSVCRLHGVACGACMSQVLHLFIWMSDIGEDGTGIHGRRNEAISAGAIDRPAGIPIG